MTCARFFLRSHRRSIVGVIFGLLALGAAQVSGYVTIAGATPAERAAFARQSESLARQLAYFAPVPTELATLGGYVSWRVFGALPLLLGLWGVWLGVSMLRGSEDTALIETLLTAGVSRRTAIGDAAKAFVVTAVVVSLGLSLSLWVTSLGELEPSALFLQAVAVVVVLLFTFGVGTVASQLAGSRRSAFGFGAATLFALNLLSSMGSASESLSHIRWLSPLSWYAASDPLARGGAFSVGDTGALLAVGVLLLTLATLAFERRDIGQPLVPVNWGGKSNGDDPSGVIWYRSRLLGTLYGQRVTLGWWLLGVLTEVVFFVLLARGMVRSLQQVPQLHSYLVTITNGDIPRGLIGLFLIGTLQLLLALYAIATVARWARDDVSGHLELELSLPISRSQVVIRRAAALAAATLGIALVGLLFMFALARSRGIHFELGRVLLSAILLVPFTVAFGAMGALWISWRPRGATFVLTGMAIISYFVQEVAPLYGWPDWVLDVSFFHLYGNPLVDDPVGWRIALLLIICITGFAGAVRLSHIRDVGA